MKSVSAQVVSSEAISLARASKILSKFVSMDNGASHAVSVYLRRAATSFAELNQFHKDLKSSPSSSSSKSRKKHTQIIAFDFEQNEPENEKRVKESEGSLGTDVDKSEVKKKKKRKGEEIVGDVSLDSSEQSGLSKKKRRKMEANR